MSATPSDFTGNPWWLAIRPKTLPASISPILVANAMAWSHESFSWLVAFLTLGCALLLQISVNLANDYFDHKSGVDTEDRLGPVRVTQAGLIPPRQVALVMAATLVSAIGFGAYLIWLGGWPIALLAAASVLGVLWYSGGPMPLASLGLGEVTVFLFFGWAAVLGTEFLQTGHTSFLGWIVATQFGFLSAAIMLVNNLRDRHTDQQADKQTLVVRIGYPRALRLYNGLLVAPLILQAYVFIALSTGVAAVLPFLALPAVIQLVKQMPNLEGDAYNQQLANTAKFMLIFALLMTLGLGFELL